MCFFFDGSKILVLIILIFFGGLNMNEQMLCF